MGCVTLLPKELSGPNERSGMFELPSHHIGPLIYFEGKVSVRVDPFAECRIHDGL
jgi:hypothetical protein